MGSSRERTLTQAWNAWAKSWGGSWAKSWGYKPEVPTGGGGVSLGNFNYRRQVEQVKRSPDKVVRKAAEEVLAFLDTGLIAQAAIASKALADARSFVLDVLNAPGVDAEALLARAEQTKILAQLEALQQLLADDEEAITVLLLN